MRAWLRQFSLFISSSEQSVTTINDVARRAGVAPVTVSRVLNGAPNVNAATREKVTQAIAELGYVPNVVARSLRSRRTRSLALILPDITNPFWPTVARGVEDAAQRRGYSVLLCNSDENAEKQARYLEVVVSQQVDGVVIAPCDSDAGRLRLLRDRHVATVVVDRRVDGWDVDTVRGDSIGGAHALVRHLIGLGHRRIALLSGPLNTSTTQDRVAGYETALKRAGIESDRRLMRFGEFREASGREMMLQVLAEDRPPTAVFAANNVIAAGAITAIGERGRRVPQDIALVCFDDLSPTSQLFPFLTVAEQPAYQMGFEAADLLLSALAADAPLAPRHIMLPSRLIIRHSCGSRLAQGSLSLPQPILGRSDMRIGQIIGMPPENLEEYKRWHAAVWPEVADMITQCHIRNYSIFHKDGLLFAYFEYVGADYAADMAKMAAHPKTQEWWAVQMPLQRPLPTRKEGEWWADMEEVFHQD